MARPKRASSRADLTRRHRATFGPCRGEEADVQPRDADPFGSCGGALGDGASRWLDAGVSRVWWTRRWGFLRVDSSRGVSGQGFSDRRCSEASSPHCGRCWWARWRGFGRDGMPRFGRPTDAVRRGRRCRTTCLHESSPRPGRGSGPAPVESAAPEDLHDIPGASGRGSVQHPRAPKAPGIRSHRYSCTSATRFQGLAMPGGEVVVFAQFGTASHRSGAVGARRLLRRFDALQQP
jgi:hypothetical protein